MSDARLGPALAALHADPAAPWTTAALASRAAMSRSTAIASMAYTNPMPLLRCTLAPFVEYSATLPNTRHSVPATM